MRTDHIQKILAGQPLDDDGRDWLRVGMSNHVDHGTPLQKCLGIKRGDYLRSLRDYHLCNAWREMNPRYSTRRKAIELRAEFDRCYKVFRHHENKDEPNSRWSRLWQEIFYAMKCNIGMPESTRQIENIVKSNGQSVS